MAKAVLVTKIDPVYDDLPEDRYHFPAIYLERMKQTIGDSILYYEPRRIGTDENSRGGRQAYFASARVVDIIPDTALPDHYYAKISDYLEFAYPVPFKEGSHYYEGALVKPDGSTNKGAFGHAVRILPNSEFELILQSGFATVLQEEKEDTLIQNNITSALSDVEQDDFNRPILERLVKRPFRDAAFSKSVKGAYEQTCAVTGLKIINGGGRTEVQAAHIKPVSQNGPDSIRNGIALSGTVHWMFDRGLISVDEDYSILKAKGKIPDPIERILNPSGKLILPSLVTQRPHEIFLRYHRDNIFKG